MIDDWTDITIVMDRSGSMEEIRDDTIGGYNRFLRDQRELPGRATVTLVQFDHEYEIVHAGVDIREAPELTRKTFLPRGQTALVGAIGRSITATGERLAALPEALRPGKVLMVILTDGMENASREFSKEKVRDMVKNQQEQWKWAFLFLGANIDAITVGNTLGLSKGSTITTQATPRGVAEAYASASMTSARYRSGGEARFTDEDRQRQEQAKGDGK